ncbi:YkgJ family cysteine cluster protein [Candidatus Woesearchaeota archaeon]|nr:YkgJ family cysteine cluster protein [Candidatus Woesearchaeota archaeon]
MIPSNCTFCGLCCTLTVKLSDNDIKRIEKTGCGREEFVEFNKEGEPILKRENGWCTFFKRDGKIGICSIYDSRPEACRDFPGKRHCDLAENPIYKYMSDNDENKRIRLLLKNAPTSKMPEEKINKALEVANKTFNRIS